MATTSLRGRWQITAATVDPDAVVIGIRARWRVAAPVVGPNIIITRLQARWGVTTPGVIPGVAQTRLRARWRISAPDPIFVTTRLHARWLIGPQLIIGVRARWNISERVIRGVGVHFQRRRMVRLGAASPTPPVPPPPPPPPPPAAEPILLPDLITSQPMMADAVAIASTIPATIVARVAQYPAWLNGYGDYGMRVFDVAAAAPERPARVAPNPAVDDPPLTWQLPYDAQLAARGRTLPWPDGFGPPPGTDGSSIIVQRHGDGSILMAEGWRWKQGTDGAWAYRVGNIVEHAETFTGLPQLMPGETAKWYGIAASRLALICGLIRVQEVRDGHIDHALGAVFAKSLNAKDTHVWPAAWSDGLSTSADAVPLGTWLRLPATFDVEALNVPEACKIFARAAQTYGIVVMDSTPTTFAFRGEYSTQEDWKDALGGTPGHVFKNFPFASLQVVSPASLQAQFP